jgi:AbrB family looped-hinge helix DNA binding protein
MAAKIVAKPDRIGRVGQRRQVVIPRELAEMLNIREGDFVAFQKQANGILIKPKRLVDPDDVLSPGESARITKARREMQAGMGIPLEQLEYDLAHQRSPRRRKTA